ncbi:pentatricopeptide repeat-containing protein At3g53360, mitochondrial-like [Phragmites australis]|uniref:pentatricopeptide repeat-containing protein At3g53360, mitochondrial-like n=1 Tax=Phragmites australis TaxID=29695 RepID=UPI002D76B73C|nr:pentatricopeptide repeat-containing protein At3g53360, mitochondrial-like [Phragmites australis]
MAPPPPLLPRSYCVCSSVTTHVSLRKSRGHRHNTAVPNSTGPTAAQQQLSLLRAHARAGRMRPAREVFDAMPAPGRSLVPWTALMSGYATHGPASEALTLLLRFFELLLRPDAFVFSVALRACAAVGSIRLGRQLHGAVAKLGYVGADLFVANGLVTMYASCRSLSCAEKVFDGIAAPDLVSWTSMLSAYTENGFDAEALMLFTEMVQDGIACDAFTLSIALRAASSLGHVGLGHQLHCCMIKMGLVGSQFLENCLIGFYGRSGELHLMRKVFDEMNAKDLISWNTIIQSYADNLFDKEALDHFRAMMFERAECDEFTLGSILHVVTRRCAFELGREIHGYLIRAGLDSDKHVMSALMDMYVNRATLQKKPCMFPLRMLRYYLLVQGKLDQFIVASSLKACASDLDLASGRMLHACILKFDMNPDSFVTSSLIGMYVKCGSLEESQLLFSRTKDPGTAAWSAVISGNCQNGQYERAMHLFRKMQLEHVQPNEFTYTAALTACMALGDVVSCMEIHSNSIRNGYGTNSSILKSLISFYLRQGQYHLALKLCLSLSNHEISWGTLVEAFAQVDDHVGIVNLFHVIQHCGVELDYHTACLILNSCGKLELLDEGLQAHAYIIKRGLASKASMSNRLIDMYSNCGSLRHAFDAFRYMSDKSASSWTSIISANVENGCPETAIRLFVQMLRMEKCPSSLAFLFALKACAKIGLVNEAFKFFSSMTEVYKIQPSEGHYSHMIEVMGRAGMFKEAEHFIDSVVPSESGASAWSLLCAAAKQNGNAKTVKLAADKLARLVPGGC